MALSAAVNAFLAPAPDAVVSNTSVLAQALAPGGLWLPCATALLGGDASLQDFLATTLEGDPNLVFPTAAWGAVRTSNIKVAQRAQPGGVTYAWLAGDYGNCSQLCGGGWQAREVACVDSLGNAAPTPACTAPEPPANRWQAAGTSSAARHACSCTCRRLLHA